MSGGAPPATPPALAVLAGAGDYPVHFVVRLLERGMPVYVAGLEGAAKPERFGAAPVTLYRLGQLGRLLDDLRRRSIAEIVLLGSLPRPSLSALMPEASTLRHLPYFVKAFQGGDDHLLSHVVRFFESQGFRVRAATDYVPALAVGEGALGRRGADAAQAELARRGFALLDTLSPFDVGQAAILADHRVVAIEAAEGTDAMIRRVVDMIASGRLKLAKGDGVLVKAAKSGQDMRVDMPAVGPETVRLAAEAGLAGIALRAGQVLVGDAGALGREADKAGLFVQGFA